VLNPESMDVLSRRLFLSRAAALFGSAVSLQLGSLIVGPEGRAASDDKSLTPSEQSLQESINGHKYSILPWTGDDFKRGHALRDAAIPSGPLASDERYDFVIVGGGLAGLTTAYYLDNHNYLLLEQYDELGGNSRGSSWRGVDFTYGAAYVGEPVGDMGALFASLNLTPQRMDVTRNRWHLGDKCFSGTTGSALNPLAKDFKKLQEKAEPVWSSLGTQNGGMISDPALITLDKVTFAEELKAFDPKMQLVVDSLLRSYNAASSDQISALAGYAMVEDLFEPCYAFPGGNAAITRALAERLNLDAPKRVQRNTFVWSVEITECGARVTYSDKEGQLHLAHCKHVVLATPPMVSARILKNVDNACKALLLSFKYGSFLVANLLLDKPSFKGDFDNWFIEPALTFTDVMIANQALSKEDQQKSDIGQVLTLYQPYSPGTEGRPLLFVGDRQAFAKSLLSQMQPLADHLDSHLVSVVLSRWGHAMPVANQGYYSRIGKLNAQRHPSFSIAHSSTQDYACAEAAIAAAKKASKAALKMKAMTKPIFI
jgi:protoporphyrinogen oxidase